MKDAVLGTSIQGNYAVLFSTVDYSSQRVKLASLTGCFPLNRYRGLTPVLKWLRALVFWFLLLLLLLLLFYCLFDFCLFVCCLLVFAEWHARRVCSFCIISSLVSTKPCN